MFTYKVNKAKKGCNKTMETQVVNLGHAVCFKNLENDIYLTFTPQIYTKDELNKIVGYDDFPQGIHGLEEENEI